VGILRRLPVVAAASVLAAVACVAEADPGPASGPSSPDGGAALAGVPPGLDKLDHLIFIVQENRSFDHYFGTYPGADGIPTDPDGDFAVCIPDKWQNGACVPPYVTRSFDQNGGPHNRAASITDVNGGRMDGFIEALPYRENFCWVAREQPECVDYLGPQGQPDVMSVHTAKTIPNYWAYAERYVLQDAMFAPVDSWTLPSHLFMLSAWSAYCPDVEDPMSCRTDLDLSDPDRRWMYGDDPKYAWTDVTFLLDEFGVEWRYYIGNDTCWDTKQGCPDTGRKGFETSYNRNPLPGFTSFWNGERADDARDNVRPVDEFLEAAETGDLPNVAWLAPTGNTSEHPSGTSTVRTGQAT